MTYFIKHHVGRNSVQNGAWKRLPFENSSKFRGVFNKGPENGPWGTLNISVRNRESFAALLLSITQYSKQ